MYFRQSSIKYSFVKYQKIINTCELWRFLDTYFRFFIIFNIEKHKRNKQKHLNIMNIPLDLDTFCGNFKLLSATLNISDNITINVLGCLAAPNKKRLITFFMQLKCLHEFSNSILKLVSSSLSSLLSLEIHKNSLSS